MYHHATKEEKFLSSKKLISFLQTDSIVKKKQMGSGDIVYCCPVCYCEAQRRFRGGDAEDDENSDVDSGEHEYTMNDITSSRSIKLGIQ